MKTLKIAALLLCASGFAACADVLEKLEACSGVSGKCVAINEGDSETSIRKKFLSAAPNSTLAFGEGTFKFKQGLTLDVDNVTIKGMGPSKTILNFKGSADADGILVTGDNHVTEDLRIKDAPKNNLKAEGVKGITYRRTVSEWTGLTNTTNGAYAFYPVQCEDVLIEDSVTIGSADAGIYVGQSKNVIVRRNKAYLNVAGIEIENTLNADVYENEAYDNTGGILVFSNPGLQVPRGKGVRVFHNKTYRNNTDNFADKGSSVASVPTGTGMMIMSYSSVEVFENELRDNNALNLIMVSFYAADITFEAAFNPLLDGVYIHDNTFSGGGEKPGGSDNQQRRAGDVAVLALAGQLHLTKFPDIGYDGYLPVTGVTSVDQVPADKRICIQKNGDANFLNFDLKHDAQNPLYDLAPYDCKLEPLPAVSIAGVK